MAGGGALRSAGPKLRNGANPNPAPAPQDHRWSFEWVDPESTSSGTLDFANLSKYARLAVEEEEEEEKERSASASKGKANAKTPKGKVGGARRSPRL